MGRINPDSGFGEKDDPEERGGPEIVVPPPSRDTVLPSLIQEAMRGQMALTRPLKGWEPEKLNPLHIQMLFDRALGMKGTELAEKYEMDASRVSVILNHPYGERILGAIIATMADRVTDPIERMRGHAHEMIEMKLEIARDKTAPKALRNAIASDWLDRIGYGARKQVEVTQKVAPSVPSEAVSGLRDALREARSVGTMDYSRYVRNYSKKEGEEETSMPPAGENPGINSSQTGGASPVSPLHLEEQERKSA